MSNPQSPDRIDIIDSLRGFALMGLFLIHAIEYFDLYWLKSEASIIHDIMFFLFAGKAYAVFAMMFGLSFFIIMDRQAARGVDFSGRFLWRLFILLLLGYLHGLLYSGDVLQVLALLGFSLLVINRCSDRAVFILSLLFIVQLPLIYQFLAALGNYPGANNPPRHWALYEQAFTVFAEGSLAQLMAFNSWSGQITKWSFMWESGRLMQMTGLFMWGLLLGRSRFFVEPQKFQRPVKWGLLFSLGASAGFFLIQRYVEQLPDTALQQQGMAKWLLSQLIDNYLSTALMIFGVLLFVTVYQHLPLCRRLLRLLAPCGRMSLTIYISQAVICVPLFYGFGLGWYDTIGQPRALLLGVAFFAVQILFAHYWIHRFYYGPLEWVWRAATYLTLQVPFKRATVK